MHLRIASPAPKPVGFGLRLRAKRKTLGYGLTEKPFGYRLNEEPTTYSSTASTVTLRFTLFPSGQLA
jgi:hypothetical protein